MKRLTAGRNPSMQIRAIPRHLLRRRLEGAGESQSLHTDQGNSKGVFSVSLLDPGQYQVAIPPYRSGQFQGPCLPLPMTATAVSVAIPPYRSGQFQALS